VYEENADWPASRHMSKKVPIFYSDSYIDFSGPELALHCWQFVDKTNVYGTAPTAAQHILIASPTSARKDFDPQPKLVLIYRPRKERLSWPE